MKYIVAAFFCLCVYGTELICQVCTGDFVFSTQQDMDDFLSNNPACTSIDGDVTINLGVVGDPILDLFPLQNITSISGSLYLADQGGGTVADLGGLSNLTTVGDELSFYAFAGDISPLQNLQSIGSIYVDATWHQDLQIFDNITTLENLTIDLASSLGISEAADLYNIFPNLTTVNNTLTIGLTESSCDTLTGFNSLVNVGSLYIGYDLLYMNHFDAMHNLQQVGVFYNYNWMINSISGFENVQSIDYLEMAIACACELPDFESLSQANDIHLFNYALTQPDFPSLSVVNGSVEVMGSANELGFVSLEIVHGDLGIIPEDITDYSLFGEIHLDSLQKVFGDLNIVGTDIDNIEFLSQLDSVGGTMHLEYNVNLSNCEIEYFCQQIPVAPEMFFISNNAGCASPEEVLASCGESYVAGLVYYDLDCDGIFNNDDVLVPNPIIVDENNLPVSGSNSQGNYFIPLHDNSTATIAVSGMPLFTTNTYSITAGSSMETLENRDFPLCPAANLHDVGVSAYVNSSFRPGINRYMNISVRNYSMYSEDVQLVLNLDDMPGVTPVIINNSGIASGNSIEWNVNDIPPFGSKWVSVLLNLNSSSTLGSVLTSSLSATLQPLSLVDVDPVNNNKSYSYTVVGSYDPNDITVNRTSIDIATTNPDEGEWLEYLIRFQNTGTAEAINVRVQDVMEEDLDLSTFQQLNASHSFTLSFDENRRVEWLFENIMLPDSFSNEEASHGFIHFRIKTNPGLGLNDVVENSAAIYFDFNEPVITNTATTIFYECTQNAEIIGVADVCEGNDVSLSSSGNWSDYTWTVNGNVVGAENQLILSDLISGAHFVSLHVADTYCMDDATYLVNVMAIPTTPVITQSGNTLTATGGGIFTWTLDGDVLADIDNTIEITESGTYSVSVMESMCVSGVASGSYEYVGVEEINRLPTMVCYPNPATELMQIMLPETWIAKNTLILFDSMGRIVWTASVNRQNYATNWMGLDRGIYQLQATNETTNERLYQTIILR